MRLPGDQDAVATVSGGGSTNCPLCNAPRDSSSPSEMIEEVIVNRCKCRARWVTLVARGSADDGFNLGEDLQTAHAILESEFCHPIRALTGNAALGAIRRVFREVSGERPKFAGIELQMDDTYGTTNITVVGSPSEVNDEQAHHMVGILLTYWRNKQGPPSVVLRVIALHEEVSAERGLVLSNVVLPDELRQMSETWLKAHYDIVPPPEVTESDGIRHISFQPEVVGALPLERPLIEIDAARDHETVHVTQIAEPSDKRPVTGETWWNVDTGEAVEVFGVGKNASGTEYVRYEIGGTSPVRMLMGDFLRYHAYETGDEAPLVVGSEHVKLDGTEPVTIRSVAIHTITLVLVQPVREGRPLAADREYTIRTAQFRNLYKPLVRRSAAERLMEEDDLV